MAPTDEETQRSLRLLLFVVAWYFRGQDNAAPFVYSTTEAVVTTWAASSQYDTAHPVPISKPSCDLPACSTRPIVKKTLALNRSGRRPRPCQLRRR